MNFTCIHMQKLQRHETQQLCEGLLCSNRAEGHSVAFFQASISSSTSLPHAIVIVHCLNLLPNEPKSWEGIIS